MMRLDKYFTECGVLSRSQVKKEIKKNLISVNGQIAKSSDMKIDPEVDRVEYRGQVIAYEEFVYYLMNKPAGIVSATEDNLHKTVVDLLREAYPEEKHDVFPVGRLDIDTEGIMLLTNDGQLSHELLSPSKHVTKTYYVEFQIEDMSALFDEREEDGTSLTGNSVEDIKKALKSMEQGLDIGEEKLTKPAKLRILGLEGANGQAELSIVEGKFHQVKRMFQALGCRVTYLKRISFGTLSLADFKDLKVGQVIKIDKSDI